MKRIFLVIALSIVFVVAIGAAAFYLFVFPVIVAVNPAKAGTVGISFASFLMIQLWILIAEYAYQAAAAFYGFTRDRLLPFRPRTGFGIGFLFSTEGRPAKLEGQITNGSTVVLYTFLSYAFSVYAFGVVFVFLSNWNSDAFNVRLGIGDAVYFSLVTSATVGFGDIIPRSAAAKAFVCIEIWMSLLYVVLLFSVTSAFLRERRQLMKRETSVN